HVAVELLNREVLDVTVSDVDLHGAVGDADADLARIELRLSRHAGRFLAAVARLRGSFGQKAGGVDLGRHLREVELDGLEVGDRPTELAPLLRVLQGGLKGAAG